MATGDKYRILCTKRKELIQLIQRDPDNIVDELLALSIITEEEYNSFNQKEDIVIKIRKLLIHIQKKGESTCQQFLECLEILFPGTNQNLQPSGHGTCDLEKSADEKPSDIIRNKRKKLIEILQKDLELILDELLSQSIVTEEEYNTLDKTEEDPKKKTRKLLILIQKKGESVCQQFLGCLEIVFPERRKRTSCKHEMLIETTPQLPKDSLIQEQEVAIQQDPEQKQKDLPKERRKAFREVLSKLKLQKYESRKLRMNDILEISSGSLKDWIPQKLRDLPWHFLRKVMALNRTARSTSLRCGALHDQGTRVDEEEQGINEQIFFVSDTDTKVSLNPLDVLCAVLLCSDSFLQQEILSKLSMCQFALPLLLPALNTSKCTLMLWAMRDIVRKWRPHSLAES
ncbi:unnamed protein product [Eretmochelys imbricata]